MVSQRKMAQANAEPNHLITVSCPMEKLCPPLHDLARGICKQRFQNHLDLQRLLARHALAVTQHS